jgi:predicted DNA-binding mobile mystery protein A
MKPNFRTMRIRQLDKQLQPFFAARSVQRPFKGWIRALREVAGLTVRELGMRTGKPHQAIAQLEKSEESRGITLKSLEQVAEAMNCKLVYALVPNTDNVDSFVKERYRKLVEPTVRAVEHSMALEGQGTGDIDEKIEAEAQRLIQRGGRRK